MNAHLDRLGCVSEELGITIGFDEVLNDFVIVVVGVSIFGFGGDRGWVSQWRLL